MRVAAERIIGYDVRIPNLSKQARKMNFAEPDAKDKISPFLGRASRLPNRDAVLERFRRASIPEGEERKVLACPVCGQKIDGRLMAVEVPGRVRELLPGAILHLVMAHDFWHPSMNSLIGRNGHEPKKLTRKEEPESSTEKLPFSGEDFSEPSAEELARSVQKKVSSPRPRPTPVTPVEPRESQRPAPSASTQIKRHRRPASEEKRERPRPSEESRQIQEAYALPEELAVETVRVARAVGTNPIDLANVIFFESGWDPSARSKSGVGLIQFNPRIIRGLRTSEKALLEMGAMAQMRYVETYLVHVSGGRPLSNRHLLFMAVFYPDAMVWRPTQPFPREVVENNTFRNRNGETFSVKTPADYVSIVQKNARIGSEQSSEEAPSSIIESVSGWISSIFGGGKSNEQKPGDGRAMARWFNGPGVSAILVDLNGREWGEGEVPAGEYQIFVPHRGSSPATLDAGRTYRSSEIGRMFEVYEPPE